MVMAPLWGGTLLENITQAVARDVISWTHVQLLSDGVDVVLQNHDELVAMCDAGVVEDVYDHMNRLLHRVPPWFDADIPLAAEGVIAEDYAAKP